MVFFQKLVDQTRFTLTPNSVLDLENEIKNLLENEILRDSITEEGLKFVQKFNDEIIARNYFEIYKELNS